MTDEGRELWERRRQRAIRWTGKAGRGYPTIGQLADETEASLNAQPPEDTGKKRGDAPRQS